MRRMALSDHILVLGIDGMDPRLTRKLIDDGKLPNIKKLIAQGACREDLVLAGGVPTITPPMWTTLATGANPGTHGITCFWNPSPDRIDEVVYALDSRACKAEPLWNVFAEANKKTLVWHWPGSSWPPTSENPNLHVVDGATPGHINDGVAMVDSEKLIHASTNYDKLIFSPKASVASTGAGCIINDLEQDQDEEEFDFSEKARTGRKMINIEMKREDGEGVLEIMGADVINSPIKTPSGWSKNLPENAKEFGLLFHNGLVRRYGLLLCNEKGQYNTVEIYDSKKSETPLAIATLEKNAVCIRDSYKIEDKQFNVVRSYYVVNIDPDGHELTIIVSDAKDYTKDEMFHPTSLKEEIMENCGDIPGGISIGMRNPLLVKKGGLLAWEDYSNWAANSIEYLIDKYNYNVVFSHHHNVDAFGHMTWIWAKDRKRAPEQNEKDFQEIMELVYEQTDRYVGHFLKYLDQGWTILLVSDHGLIVNEDEECSEMGDPFGVNGKVMNELGYHIMKTDENGKMLKETDWSKTTAVAQRGNHIYINLKGREKWGIVKPEDKYQLEEKIIDDLYSYRDENGERIIALALRNKDAVLLGLGGDRCGDIIYWNVEHKGRVHGDTLPASKGYADTSVSPIFVAAGKGIKEGFTTDRYIRSSDVAPTIAVLGGVRFPANCEGAPAYQIFSEEI